MAAKLKITNLDKIIEAYKSGMSLLQLEIRFKIDDSTIRSHLIKAGVQIRSVSEGRTHWLCWMRRNDPRRLQRMARKSGAARRNRKQSFQERVRRAQALYRTGTVKIGEFEQILIQRLTRLGFKAIGQWPIGPYNVDLAICKSRIAMEVRRGNANAPDSSIRRERLEYILNQGWAVLVIYTPYTRPLIVPEVTQKMIAFLKITRSTPSLRSQYGMIGSDGQPVTPKGLKLPRRSRVSGF